MAPPGGPARWLMWARLGVIVWWQAAKLDRELAAGVSLRASDAHALRALRITGRRRRYSLAQGLARVVRSASNPDLLNPAYNCGDGVHPSSIGYFQMGKSVELGLFGLR